MPISRSLLMNLLDPKPLHSLRQNNIDSISGESCQPHLSHMQSGVPEAQLKETFHPSILSLFILLISFLYQTDTGMLFILHNRPSGACWGPHLKKTLKFYPTHYPFAIHPLPDSPRGVYFSAILFLLTWTRSKESLGLSTSLACNSWTSWFQHRGESGGGGGLCSDRRPIHTADASGWQV